MLDGKRILVTGGGGFLGSHIVNYLKEKERVSEKNIFVPRSKDYDLRERENVLKLFDDFSPDFVIHCATTTRGIDYNKEHPGKLFYDSIMMNTLVLEEARKRNVKKFVAIGSALCYPSDSEIPLKENDLWKGYPHPLLASFSLATKMMLVQSEAYRKEYGLNSIFIILANLYGPGDHFFGVRPHVIPATIKKVDDAITSGNSTIEAFGTGKALREFLYVEDAARGIIEALKNYNSLEPLNLGSGMEISMKDLIEKIANIMNFKGKIEWDSSQPEGQLRRCMNIYKAKEEIGFQAEVDFDEGLRKTYKWYKKSKLVL